MKSKEENSRCLLLFSTHFFLDSSVTFCVLSAVLCYYCVGVLSLTINRDSGGVFSVLFLVS